MRILLVIFALWVLAVEPTFAAYERIEQQNSRGNHRADEGSGDLDQPIPPHLVVAPSWVNHHAIDLLTTPLPSQAALTSPLDFLVPACSPAAHCADPCMPYPPSARPLRL